ncbi:hypothetical protein PDENDC454_02530 [Paenibacillus dendritiformis C454]|uniref:Uncharacterized protein n=1 Tax=Paenibacillus dendritiformis C454 TaxID=1131935 RepID=H3SAH1_9BACL|nr:hypothetical protein [Paenibacillus dendritiformis]EHQ63974.1 hypothetical protein PDENDC454_02530 [Paenibacillus dendritiformis C454]
MKYVNITPKFNNNNQVIDGVSIIKAQTSDSESFRVFDGNPNTGYRSSIFYPPFPDHLGLSFPTKHLVKKYSIILDKTYLSVRSWEIHGSNDNFATYDVLHEVNDFVITPNKVEELYLPEVIKSYMQFRIRVKSRYGSNSWGIYELAFYELLYEQKILIKNNSSYYKYDGISWELLGNSVPTEEDYLLHGINIEDISSIPESAWAKFNGEIELCYYTENQNKPEASFNIVTKPFTLAEEFDDQTIKIIEYTDNPEQEDSTITLETEPFTFYDEVGDSFNVLYYTDDPDKTEAELEISHNYSPLDELDGDFELVTWTMEEEAEVQEELKPKLKEKIEDGDLYGVTVDLSKGTLNIK